MNSTMKHRLHRAAFVALLSLATVALPSPSSAAQTAEIPSAFLIAKSGNKNQVHYAVDVTESCAPRGSSPVRPYWLMLERGPDATEPLQDGEQRAFGIQRQDVADDKITVALRGLPSRVITVRTFRTADGKCASTTSTTIAGAPARLANIYVRQKLFGIDYVQFTGWATDGAIVRERVSP
jgi:hypothetical protein